MEKQRNTIASLQSKNLIRLWAEPEIHQLVKMKFPTPFWKTSILRWKQNYWISIINVSFLQNFRRAWKEGLIVPIGKPQKPKTQVESYRPITLLSCIGKLYERIIQRRLEFIAEKDNYLSQSQSGFRKGLSTTDVLLRLEHNYKEKYFW